MPTTDGLFTLPTRVFVREDQRAKLQRLVLQQGIELPDLLSELLTTYLDSLPDPAPPDPAPPPDPPAQAELARLRAELARLRARRQATSPTAPAWLNGYIADLQAQIAKLGG